MMLNLFFLKFFLFICVFILSLLIVFMSHRGFFGIFLHKFLGGNRIGELFVSVVMVVGVLMFISNLFLMVYNYFISLDSLGIGYSCVVDENSNTADPVRYWPTGTKMTWGIIGTAAALYRASPGSHRAKTGVISMAITIPLNVWTHAVENPNGCQRLMFSWVHYKNTGTWPGYIPTEPSEEPLDTALAQSKTEDESNLDSVKDSSKFLPSDFNDFWSNFSFDNLFLQIIGVFRPVHVEGHLDDLIGQQLFIHFLLISIIFDLIILFTTYFFIQTMYNNREFITKRFDNRFIRLYIKYQLFLSRISLFILPAFIFLGLIELFVGLYFLITHPIPFELLPVDLHTYLKTK